MRSLLYILISRASCRKNPDHFDILGRQHCVWPAKTFSSSCLWLCFIVTLGCIPEHLPAKVSLQYLCFSITFCQRLRLSLKGATHLLSEFFSQVQNFCQRIHGTFFGCSHNRHHRNDRNFLVQFFLENTFKV